VSLSDRLSSLSPAQRELFELLRKKNARPARPEPPPLVRRPAVPAEEAAWPLTVDQERLWFLYQLDPADSSYNIPMATTLVGAVDPGALVRSLTEIVRRHEAWRTTFPARDGSPVQVVHPPAPVPMPVIDLSGLPEERRVAESRRVLVEEVRRPFDLEQGPLLRCSLIRREPQIHDWALTAHHIVTDWYSSQVFWGELAALYPSLAAGRPVALPELPVQYADFAVWQRTCLSGEALREHLDYWTHHLAGAPLALELPTDHPRPVHFTTRGRRIRMALSRARSEGIKNYARVHRATPFMVILGLLQTLLARASGQDQVIVASPNVNRARPELQQLLGFFITQLVYCTDLGEDPTFSQLTDRVRQVAMGALAHQDLPFGKLVEALRPERDTSRPPVAQVTLLLLEAAMASAFPDLGGLRMREVELDPEASSSELTLALWDSPEGFKGHLEFNSDLFDTTTVARLAEGFVSLLDAVVAGSPTSDAPLSALPVQSEAATHQVLREWNDTRLAGEAEPVPVHRMIEAQAGRTPEAVALVDGEERWTYRELTARAAELAERLRRMGVGPEARVAVCLPRSGELVASLLGILSSGAAYVPLDPAYPQERLRFMLEDCGAAALVTRPELEPLLPDLPVPRVNPHPPTPSPTHPPDPPGEGAPPPMTVESVTGLPPLPGGREGVWERGPGGEGPGVAGSPGVDGATADHLAYLIYTSGSTGRPKAVGVRHHNVSTFVSWAGELFAEELAGGVLFSTSVCFDLSVFEVFGTLAHGGTLILAENALALTEIPAAGEVGLINTVPSAMAELLRLAEQLPPSVRAVSLCGEPFYRRLADDIQARGIGRAINLYGPSEDTVYSTWELVPHGEELEPAIGRPITGTQAYVLDRGLWPVPMGARGELYLAGDGLARGYMGRPDLTADRFVPDPFADRPGGRMYRTGDLSRWRSGGALEFLGRIDRQVKVRGFRIELGEIEAVLAALPGVADVAVVVRDGRLAAYLVPDPEVEGEALVEAARNAVLDRLPRHMAPALWAALPALPHTPNGKVDHKALPAPEALDGGSGAEAAPPRTPAEEALAAIWCEVLGLPGVGIHDNFFRLGGDSILSIRVVARARQAGLILTPRQIFERQTVAELAAAAAPLDTTAPVAETGPVTGAAPLTPIQRWFLEARPADPHHFNQAVLLETRTPVEDRELRRAVAALLEHHDALRLRFPEEGHAVFSPPAAEPPVTRVDLSAIPAERRRAVLEEAASSAQASLDLASGPLLRAVFFDLGAGSPGRLLLVIHHLVVDGVSWRILLEDLQTFPGLPARTTSWQRWAEQLTEHARSAAVQDEAAFWLAQPEPEPLPVDRSEGEDTEASADTVSVTLPTEATRALLREAAAAYHGRPDDLLLTAVARAFQAWTGSSRLVLWLEGHGREEALPGLPAMDLSRTVGWFTSLFPVALDLQGASEPGAAIRRVKETLREIPAGGIGHGLLRFGGEETAAALAARLQPEVVFNHLGRLDLVLGDDSPYAPAPESSGWPRSPRALRRHRLEINAAVAGGRLEVHWTYGRNVHERATIERLARRFASELEALIAHCLAPGAGGWTPSDFPLARLGQNTLDRLTGNDPLVEDVYPLSPMQAGLLFHGIYAPATEIYFEQISCTIRGDLDAAAFHRAWQRVVDRHGILRTAFAWEGLEQPLQVVRRGVQLPWVEADWQDVGETGAADAQLAAFAAADRQRPFSPGRAPLLRAALLRTGERTHRFVWSFHHLLVDGWSLPPLFQEVFTLYELERRSPGGADPLPPPALPYRDFVAWLARRDHAADERYWRQALAGITGPTPLPWDSAAPPVAAKADDFAQHQAALSEEVTATLDAFARERGMTLNTVVQGAWAILLSRWSGEREVVFGAVTSGRPPELPGFETAIGLFINTLPVRRSVDPETPLAAWLADLQRTQIEARQHEHAPLAEVQRWTDVPAREPLFQSLLVFENYPLDETVSERLGGLQLEAVNAVERTSFPLSLAVVPGRHLRLRITHDGRLAPAGGELLLSWLQRLLEGFAAAPDRPLGDFDLLSEAEREQIRREHEESARSRDAEDSLTRFERQAAETPEASAVRDAAGTLTFAELDRRSTRLAWSLCEAGVGPESRVALAVGRSAGLLAGILGIWKAGAAWVPLDPAHPRERTAAILRDSEAAALVTSREALDLLPPGLPPVIRLEDPEDSEVISRPPSVPLLPERAAYVLYTSGSTGDPKGVVIDHAALAGYLAWVDETLLGPVGFALPATSALTFDASLKQLLGPLLAGREVRILPEETATQPLALATALAMERCAAFNGVPALWSALLDLVESGDAPVPDALRRVLLGGEALSPEVVERTRRLLPQAEIWNLYGPTEATANATAARIAPGDPVDAITIGRPLPGVRVVVLDRDGRPVPAGASGELCLGGTGLARGYLGRPDLTAERFIPNPFSSIPGDRLYRTGDLVRRRLDDLLEHRGRTDLQVKVRGIRIELGEIEAVLRRHPAVREAVVTVRPGGRPGDARLDAWIATEPSVQITAADLRTWLRERLPPAAVPADLTLLPELPRLPNGKIDRRALASRSPEGETGGRPYAAPANDVEEKLAGLWSDLLGAERVGRGDNFFELGGHSLLATQLMVRIRASFSVDLPLPAIFEAEDLAALAQQILALRLGGENPEELALLMAELDGLSDEEVESLLGDDLNDPDGLDDPENEA
jgi:amino acid adenylation domain-containing protein/non-ribosomal peptide synthase protein (TIGR01720 family)